MTIVRSFTRCAECAHAVEVMEPDRFGVKHPSTEVIHCSHFQQFRAMRITRTCAEFKRIREAA